MVMILAIVRFIMAIVGWVWVMIIAFSDSVPWGVGVFCFSPLAIVFGILHWDDANVPTILYAVGLVLSIIARVIS
jgi:hypothetical protein